MNRRLKSLIRPLTVLVVGAIATWGAETAVGRFQN